MPFLLEERWVRFGLLASIHVVALLSPSLIVWTGYVYWDQENMVLLYAGLQGLVVFYSSSLIRAKPVLAYLCNIGVLLALAFLTGAILIMAGKDELWTYFSGCDVWTHSPWYMAETQARYLPVSGCIGALLAVVRLGETSVRRMVTGRFLLSRM